MAYIYKITNDINGKIYIGKTYFSIEKRFQEHCKDAFRPKIESRPLYSAMQKYGIEHFHIEQIEETDNPEEREKYWIEFYGSFKNGYNATKGGDGKPYLDYDLILKTYNEIKNCKKVAELLNCNKESVVKILKMNGYSSTDLLKNSHLPITKAVAMCNKDTKEIIQTYSSTTEAAKALGKITSTSHGAGSHIADVCKGKRKSAYGYFWKYI